MNPTNNKQIIDFEDDKTVPFETRVYYSKSEAVGYMFLGGFTSVLATIPILFVPNIFIQLFGFFMCVLALYLIYVGLVHHKKAVKKVTQIIFNEEGLQTVDSKFLTWDMIKCVDIILDGSKYCLVCDYEGGKEKFSFYQEYYTLQAKELTKLLKIYRGRFEANNLKNVKSNE